jgi:16S rRNA processing protein RimM
MNSNDFLIAQIGKTVGLKGELKLHLHTDFPEQFKSGLIYQTSLAPLEIVRVDLNRGLVLFKGYEDVELAKRLVNVKIYSTIEETKSRCNLKKDEFFWFELEGLDIVDGDELLGKVLEVIRIGSLDYLEIETSAELIKKGLPKSFLIPYIDRYIVNVDKEAKKIVTLDTKELLIAS